MGGMECPICGMRFENAEEMRRHGEEKHPGEMERPVEERGA